MAIMTDQNPDPLSKLIADTDELDRQKLSDLLSGYCLISKDGNIHLAPNFPNLDTTGKITVILLAQKAIKALGMSETEQLSPKQIEIISGLPGSTVRNNLILLRQKRIVDNSNGNYSVPNHVILNITLNSTENDQRSKPTRPRISGPRKTKPNSESLEKLLQIDQSQIGEKRLNLLLSSGKYTERALAVLAIAREQGIESLTPSEITQFLKEKIRANVIRENVSLALGRGTRYVDRFRVGQNGAFGYKIMVAGEKLLESALNEKTINNSKDE